MTGATDTGPMKAAYADCYLGQLHYLYRPASVPGGAPVLLISPRSRSCRKLARHLPAEQAAYIIDIPGLGNSSPLREGASMPDVARAVAEFMDAAGIGPAHVFGVHTGGKVAAALAAHWPDKVLSLMVCGKSHSIVPEIERRNVAMKEQSDMPDSAVVRFEGKYLDDTESALAMPRLYAANFAFDLAQALRACRMPVRVIEITSPEEDLRYGRQARALAAHAARGSMAELPQVDSTGIDFYSGAAAMAAAIVEFIGQPAST